MKLGVLFSGGKDSTYAAYLAKRYGHELTCLVSVFSENKDSFMFHTPSISKVNAQADAMGLPLLVAKTLGKKEEELADLKAAVLEAKQKYSIEGVVTGAIESCYQAARVQKICMELNLDCFNPLWQKDQITHLQDLIRNNFNIIITGVSAFPLDQHWLGRKIDQDFINEITALQERFKINPAGEGGEFETFVLNCPLFKKPLALVGQIIEGEGNAWRMEVDVC